MTKVLCVDDNPLHLCLVTALCETEGYSVICADDPRKAIDLARKSSFDLAILDYELPHMNGTALARKLKRIRPRVRIVLLSGALAIPSEELKEIDEYIAKGESPCMLLSKMRCLTGPQARAASA